MSDRTIEADPTTFDLDATPVAEQAMAVRSDTALSTPAQAPMMPMAVDIGALLTGLLEKTSNPNVNKDTFLAAKDAVREFIADQKEQAFNWDMSLVQAEMLPVVRRLEVKLEKADGTNAGQGYKVADALDIDEMIRPIYTKYGFSLTHSRRPREADGGGFVVVTTLRHRGGHSIIAEFPIALDTGPGRNNAKAAGSTDTYGRKYNILGLFNIVRKNEDTDAAMAGGNTLRSQGDDGKRKGIRLGELFRESGLLAKAETPFDRRAAATGWLRDENIIDYDINDYLDIHIEDYNRIVRLLRIEGDKYKREQEKGVQI